MQFLDLEGAATVSFDAITSAIFLFNNVVCRHGMIEKIFTDQGKNFEALLFHLFRLVGANKVRCTAYHAMTNWGIERVNKVIKPDLAKFVNQDHDNWDLYLQMAISA